MATNNGIAPHETFELHELLTFKNVCATKSAAMSALVQDPELKTMLQKDFTTSQGHIMELRNLLQQSELFTGQQGDQMGQGTSGSVSGETFKQ